MALDYAKESLPRFGHSHLSSAHLVLGLLTLRGGVGDNVLRKFGFSVEGVEVYFSSQRSSAEQTTIQDRLALGRSAVSALERAEAEARTWQHTYMLRHRDDFDPRLPSVQAGLRGMKKILTEADDVRRLTELTDYLTGVEKKMSETQKP